MTIKNSRKNSQLGFTLIELLVVIGILAILLAITLVAINPAKQFAQANNTKRSADISTILDAIDQYAADNNGALPTNMPAPGASAEDIASGHADLCSALTPVYIAALPADPTTGTPNTGQIVGTGSNCPATYDTGYQVSVGTGASNRVTVSADGAQSINGITPVLSVTR